MHNRVTLFVVYISMLLMCALSIVYSNFSVRDNNKKFCDIITTVNDAYDKDNPTSPIGIQLKKDYRELEVDLGCKREERHA